MGAKREIRKLIKGILELTPEKERTETKRLIDAKIRYELEMPIARIIGWLKSCVSELEKGQKASPLKNK